MKKKLAMLLGMILIVTSLAACGGSKSEPAQAPAEEEEEAEAPAPEETPAEEEGAEAAPTSDVTYGVVVRSVDEYCTALAEGGEEICEELGWANITLNSDGDVQKQIDAIQSMVAQGVKGIYVHDLDAVAIAPTLKKALDAGVNITVSSNLIPEMGDYLHHDLIYYVQWDNEKAFYDLTKATIELMGGKGKILCLTSPQGFTITQQFLTGFRNACAEYPDIEIVNEIDCNSDRALGLSYTEDALTANPDIDAIISTTEVITWGTVEAIENLGIDFDDIIITTNDSSKQTMQMLIDGKLDIITGCPAKNGPVTGARILEKILAGEDVTDAQDVEWVNVDEHLANVAYMLFDKDNADLSFCDY